MKFNETTTNKRNPEYGHLINWTCDVCVKEIRNVNNELLALLINVNNRSNSVVQEIITYKGSFQRSFRNQALNIAIVDIKENNITIEVLNGLKRLKRLDISSPIKMGD